MKTTYKLLLGTVFVVVVGVGGYYAWQANSGNQGLANLSANSKLSDSEVSELVARVGKFLVLPTDEKPSVVVIKDAQTLADQQAFYKGSKDGDILIIYSSRAIIYDVAANKLVNVGPIVRNDATPVPSAGASIAPTASSSATPTPAMVAITIDVRNGTATAGLAGATASTLKQNKLFIIGKVGDARSTYKETTVVDLTTAGSVRALTVQELVKTLKAVVVTKLPAGEAATTADALVIVGK